MSERRRSERIKCRFECELLGGGKPVAGTVVDLSAGGLAVRCSGSVQQGDSVTVRMAVPGRGKLDVDALVWHVRHARRRDTGESVQLLGLMLSKASDAFRDLVPKGPSDVSVVMEDDDAGQRPASFAKGIALVPHRVRLRHLSTPRTRVVTVDAASTQEACSIAARELGKEWAVLEALGRAAK